MILIKGERGTGKTTELVKISSHTGQRILCANSKRARLIEDTAKELGLDIPQPLAPGENTKGMERESILVDDIEDVLQAYTNARIDYATVSCELEKVVNNKPSGRHEKEQEITVDVDIDTEEATKKLDELEEQLEKIVRLQERIDYKYLSSQDKTIEKLIDLVDNIVTTLIYQAFEE